MITAERSHLQDKRQKQEEELEKILDTNAVEVFGTASAKRGNPMISPQLKQKLQRKRKLRENEEKKNKWMISSTNPWRKRWDYAIIIAAMISVAFIPVRFALNK